MNIKFACAKCFGEFEKLLRSEKGDVCETCFLKLHQGTFPVDEFSLQPGEMTTAMAAYYLTVTVRTIQNYAKYNKIPHTYVLRRCSNGETRSQNIFQIEDLDKFDEDRRNETHSPAVSPKNEMLARIPENGDDISGNAMQIMAQMFEALQKSNTPTLLGLTGKVFIGIDELSEVTNLAVSVLRREIVAAEKSGTLQRYPGKKGRAVWKANDLTLVLAKVLPVDTDTIYAKTHVGRATGASAGPDQSGPGAAESAGSETGRRDAETDAETEGIEPGTTGN